MLAKDDTNVLKMSRKIPPPDQGWSWVVAAGLTVSSFIMGGFLNAFGIFFAAFMEEFEASVSSASLIQGLRSAIYMVLAPLAAVLCDRYSERTLLMTSALLCFVSCVVASFAPNMEIIILSTGGIFGAGLSCYFNPVQIAIGKYFDKRRSLAICLSFCGFSLSQIAMPPLNIALLDTYSLRGTLLIYSGLMFNLLPMAMLVRPRGVSSNLATVESIPGHPAVVCSKKLNGGDPKISAEKSWENVPMMKFHEAEKSTHHDDCYEFSKTELSGNGTTHADIKLKTDEEEAENCEKSLEAESLSNNINLQTLENEKMSRNYPDDATIIDKAPYISSCDIHKGKCNACILRINSALNILEFSLFKDVTFSVYCLAISLGLVPFSNIAIYMFPTAEEYGFSPEKAALLLTIMGICDVVGRLGLGALGDVKKIGPKLLFILGTTLFGFCTLILPFTKDFTGMAIMNGSIGLVGSSVILLNMPILVEMIGLEKLGQGVALTSFVSGILNAIAPPVLGYIKDATTTFDYVYFTCAGILFLAAAMMLVERMLNRRRNDSRKYPIIAELETES